MLRGKGVWAYRLEELDRAIQIAPQMGATHILYKVGQGSTYYAGMAQVARRIKQAGFIPLAWTWLLLEDPQGEAEVAARAFQDGFQHFAFDTESAQCRNRFEQAEKLGQFVRAARLDLNRLYNCSFPNISHHRDLPYDQMNDFCKGGLMPMSYGTFFAPGSTVPPDRQAQRVIDEWAYGHYEYWVRQWGYRPPLYPVLGPYHDEYGQVRMSPAEFQIWLDRLEAHRPTFFSVFTAAVINHNLLPLVRAFPLGEGDIPAPSGMKVEVVSPEAGFLNIRPTPSTDLQPITRAEHGAVLDALEPEGIVEAKVGQQGQWLRVRVPGGVEGYTAAWYLRLAGEEAEEVEEPTIRVVVVSPETGYLNVRPTPSIEQAPIAQVDHGMALDALDPEAVVRARVGQTDRWIKVRTPDGRQGYVAAWYLRLYDEVAKAEVQLEIFSPEAGFLNVRPTPSTKWPSIAKLDHGTVVDAWEPEENVRAKIGQEDKWIRIRIPDGPEGYVAAWYVRIHEEVEEEVGVQVEVISPELGWLSVRPQPSTERPPITRVDHGAILRPLEPEADVRAKVGQEERWLRVRTPEGLEGYVAAWYLGIYKPPIGELISYTTVHSTTGLNLREEPGANTKATWRVEDGTLLEVQEDPSEISHKLGKDRWIKVRTPSLHEGYVNGMYLRAKMLADKRQPVEDMELPAGECAWIFGMHAAGATTPADFRFLFQSKDKTGWTLFTEAIGDNPRHSGGHDYGSWSRDGYGVIVRLNNGYEPAGTIPMSNKYPDFARACANYVANSAGCHIWIIGNEQNNIREHPGGAQHPTEHITPRRYAAVFNLARQRIKEVQPEAIVVPGAVDPYNTAPWKLMGNRQYRPLEYFKEMLSYIADLDGIALHTYTHWLDVDLITKKTVFTDEPLPPGTPHEHYYDFLAYRTFAEAIPEKWRDRPIYITESNHWLALEHPPRNKHEERRIGWVNRDKGWVRAAYAEIDRWNNTPHAQQIHCLLLYRWTGDEWELEHKREIHKDFKKALDRDYRWRE